MPFDSVLEGARRRHPSLSDESLMAVIAKDIVDVLDLEPPVAPEIVASYQGIARIERGALPWAGCLNSEAGELVITVRSSDPPQRQRFTVLHEVAHTFFPGYSHMPQYRCTPLAKRERRDRVETLCDIGAGGILLPARYVTNLIVTASFDLDTVEQLADECGASLEAAARRLVSLWPAPALFIRLERTTKPRAPHQAPKLRVASSLADNRWPYIPLHKSLRDTHVAYDCLDGEFVDCVTDLDDLFTTPVGSLDVHARSYPFTDNEGVLHERVLVIARNGR
jgi:Zn-dependent peptidase ImmA (M78 family)